MKIGNYTALYKRKWGDREQREWSKEKNNWAKERGENVEENER